MSRFRGSFAIAAFLIPLLCGAGESPKSAPFPEPPPGFRIGMELELSPEFLANLMPYFDFARIHQTVSEQFAHHLPTLWEDAETQAHEFFDSSVTRDYLRNRPDALARLPRKLREELTRGLNLGEQLVKPGAQLLNADGAPIIPNGKGWKFPGTGQPRLIQPGEATTSMPWIAPQAKPTAPPAVPGAPRVPEGVDPAAAARAAQDATIDAGLFNSSSGGRIAMPNTQDWRELQRRWEALSPGVRQAAVRWEDLGSREQACLFAASAKAMGLQNRSSDPSKLLRPDAVAKGNAFLALRKDAPADVREHLERLVYVLDRSDVGEFKHRETLVVRDPREFLDDLRFLAKRAGVEREVFDPERARLAKVMIKKDGEIAHLASKWGALHYHISKEGDDLTGFVKALNENLLARRISLGMVNDLRTGSNEQVKYTEYLGAKGLVRLLSKEHFEVRAHHEELEDALRKYVSLLADPDRAGVIRRIEQDTARLFDDAAVLRIMRYNPMFLSKLQEYVPPERLTNLANRISHQLSSGEKISDPFGAAEALYNVRGSDPAAFEFAAKAARDEEGFARLVQDSPNLLASMLRKQDDPLHAFNLKEAAIAHLDSPTLAPRISQLLAQNTIPPEGSLLRQQLQEALDRQGRRPKLLGDPKSLAELAHKVFDEEDPRYARIVFLAMKGAEKDGNTWYLAAGILDDFEKETLEKAVPRDELHAMLVSRLRERAALHDGVKTAPPLEGIVPRLVQQNDDPDLWMAQKLLARWFPEDVESQRVAARAILGLSQDASVEKLAATAAGNFHDRFVFHNQIASGLAGSARLDTPEIRHGLARVMREPDIGFAPGATAAEALLKIAPEAPETAEAFRGWVKKAMNESRYERGGTPGKMGDKIEKLIAGTPVEHDPGIREVMSRYQDKIDESRSCRSLFEALGMRLPVGHRSKRREF